MATTLASDFIIPEVYAAYARQKFEDSLDFYKGMIGYGADSPIQLVGDPTFQAAGYYFTRGKFKRIGSGLVTRRQVLSTSSVTPQKLEGVIEYDVKLHRKIGPIDISEDAPRLANVSKEEITAEIAMQSVEELFANIQTTALTSLIGAVDGMTATAHSRTVWNAATRTNMSPEELNALLALMGDKREQMRRMGAIVMRSETQTDLLSDAIGRSYAGVGDRALSGEGNTNTLGMPFVVVDNSTLTTADAGFDKYHTLVLGPGAARIQFTQPMKVYPMFGPILDLETVVTRWRADFDFSIGVNGFAYDTANGGANPTDATLATTSNWDPVYSNHKEVMILKSTHNYSGN